MRKKISQFGILWVLLLAIAGCTTPKQWKADSEVDALCAKDGGNKIYETVTLPKERFNQQGYFEVSFEGYDKPTDEYYGLWKSTDIDSINTDSLTIYQSHYKIYRRRDKKLLGESISYSRRGGDIPLPIHPSSYSCYKGGLEHDLIKEIFKIK